MKKFLSLTLVLSMLASLLTGCGAPKNSGDDVPSSGPIATTSYKTQLSPENTKAVTEGVTVDVGDFVLDGTVDLTVAKKPAEENEDEGYKIQPYDISIGALSKLDDFITIRIPYDTTYCDEGQDPARCVGAKYKNEATGEWEDVLFEVDAQANELVIYTDHLSIYGAFYVKDEGKRNALITDVLGSGLYMSDEQTLDFSKKIAGEEPGTLDTLADYAEKASGIFFDYSDRIDNAINVATLGGSDLPPGLDTSIPDTSLTLFSAIGYIATAKSIMELGYKQARGRQVDDGEVLNLIRDVSSKAISYAADNFTKVGCEALSISMAGVLIIDKMLTAFAEEAKATKLEDIAFVYHHFNESFEGFGHKVMRPKDWRAKVIQVLEAHPGDADRAISALEAGFTKYASEFFSLTEDQMSEVASDVPNVNVKRIPAFTEAEKNQLIDDYIAHLKDKTMPAVLTSVQNYIIKKVELQELEALSKAKEYYNTPIAITLKEEIPEGGKSQFTDYRFRFAPLKEGTVKSSWTGKWPESGEVRTSATLMGFFLSGLPHTVEFFKPDADLEKDRPEFTAAFTITVPKIDIPVSGREPLTVEAFMGTWVDPDGCRTVLIQSGGNVIEKEPDLSWYGGSVSCTEYTPEYDAASQTLMLRGVTTWVEEPDTLFEVVSADKHQLELDASSSGIDYTAVESKDGIVTVMESDSYTYTRQ